MPSEGVRATADQSVVAACARTKGTTPTPHPNKDWINKQRSHNVSQCCWRGCGPLAATKLCQADGGERAMTPTQEPDGSWVVFDGTRWRSFKTNAEA
jgi:hypothetical protein